MCSGQQDPEYYLYGICFFWGYHSYLCGAEPGSRKDGPCAERGISDPGHDPGVQFRDHGSDPFPGKIYGADLRRSNTVAWCYPFLGSIYLYRNALQGLGYGLVPMLGGVFELIARWGIVALVAGNAGFGAVCMSDPAAWIAALIPLIPYYFWTMRKEKKKETA